jgi:hypothetical protein
MQGDAYSFRADELDLNILAIRAAAVVLPSPV